MKKLLLILTLPIFLAGCWDKVEIEDRGFVVSLGIDKFKDDKAAMFDDGKNNNRYTVTMSLPNVETLVGTGSKEDSESVKTSASETVSAAMRLIDSYSSEKLYFGHTKAVILGEELLKDRELLKEAVDALERNRLLSRKLVVLATTDDVKTVLEAKIPGEPLVGVFLANFYRNSESTSAMTFRQDLEGMNRHLRYSGDVLVPQISLEDDKLKLGGAAVINDFQLAGWLNDKQTRGYLWFTGQAKGAEVTAEYEGGHVPLHVNINKTGTYFYEDGGYVICRADIRLKGVIDELGHPVDTHKLGEVYERLIAEEVEQLFTLFHDELEVDGFGLCDRLRKENYGLYLAHGGSDAYAGMRLVANVTLEITGTGVINQP